MNDKLRESFEGAGTVDFDSPLMRLEYWRDRALEDTVIVQPGGKIVHFHRSQLNAVEYGHLIIEALEEGAFETQVMQAIRCMPIRSRPNGSKTLELAADLLEKKLKDYPEYDLSRIIRHMRVVLDEYRMPANMLTEAARVFYADATLPQRYPVRQHDGAVNMFRTHFAKSALRLMRRISGKSDAELLGFTPETYSMSS
ncbi:MAG: hypothetical protein KDI13_04240 [Alphaproteobacteria bacterium]|nr:hypothetical protein [Alphaproteobacteria bacterium]